MRSYTKKFNELGGTCESEQEQQSTYARHTAREDQGRNSGDALRPDIEICGGAAILLAGRMLMVIRTSVHGEKAVVDRRRQGRYNRRHQIEYDWYELDDLLFWYIGAGEVLIMRLQMMKR